MPAVDSHVHIFDPAIPLYPQRSYDPELSQLGTAARLLATLKSHGLDHALLVQAEPYRYDNTAMLNAIRDYPGVFRGIALVPPDVPESELIALKAAGVVGVRYNLMSFGTTQFDHPATPELLRRLAKHDMFLQIHCEFDQLAQVMPLLRTAPCRLMIDHFGRPDITKGLDQPGYAALLELGRQGNTIVKLSGAFRSSRAGPPYDDIMEYIQAAIGAFGIDNCVWGSDWPFVRVNERIDYGPEFDCVSRYVQDAADREALLWRNPVRLFGFSAG